jgi:ribosomal protein S27E
MGVIMPRKATLKFNPFELSSVDIERFVVPTIRTKQEFYLWSFVLRRRLFAARLLTLIHNLNPNVPPTHSFNHYRYLYCPKCQKIQARFSDGKKVLRCECGEALQSLVVPILKEQCPKCGKTRIIDPITFIGRCPCGLWDYLAATFRSLQDVLRSERSSEAISELVEMLYRFNVAQVPEGEGSELGSDNQVDMVSPSGDETSSAAVG